MDNGSGSLAILIPAYNEEERIGKTLEDYLDYLEGGYPGQYVVVVVLNGCRDRTMEVVRRYQATSRHLEFIDIAAPVGKGGALIEGLRRYQHFDYVSYVDADGATAAPALLKLVEKMSAGSTPDVVIGSRWMAGSVLHQSQTRLRQFASRVFHAIVELFFGLRIADTQCPAKVLRGRIIDQLLPRLSIADLSFDVNLLVSARVRGFRILECPTEWTDKEGSKVTRHLFRSSLVMFLSIVRLRLIYSPFYRMLSPLRPLEQWIYLRLGAPAPVRDPNENASSPGDR
jgi:glycosyltransferase involved in cell wall biosynthesis